MSKVVKRIINTIVDVIVVIILIVSLLVVMLSLTSGSTGVANIFGFAPLSVQSNSMEPTIMVGDVIIGKVSEDWTEKYEVGDVVTFPIEIDGVRTFNTHRIVEVFEDEGITYYRTQGDNEKTNPTPDEKLQTSESIVAKWTGTRIPGIGGFLSFIRTQSGFFLCVLLPMILFFVYEAIRVIMNIIAYNKEKAAEEAAAMVANSELTEEQKQRAIAEYLAQQNLKAESELTVQTPADGDNPEAEQ